MLRNKKNQYWAMAMTMDEAIRYEDEGTMSALATGEEGCTHAVVWRASTRAVAYGRRKRIVAADAKPAPAGLTKKPAATAAVTKKPAATAAAPVTVAASPATAANAPVTDNRMYLPLTTANAVVPPTLPNAPAQITQSGAKQQPDDQQRLPSGIAPPEAVDQAEAAKRKRELADPASALEQEQLQKRVKQFSAKEKAEKASQLLREKDDNCLHFIELTNAYIADDMSKEYKEVVTRMSRVQRT